jgi:hypothetical protein
MRLATETLRGHEFSTCGIRPADRQDENLVATGSQPTDKIKISSPREASQPTNKTKNPGAANLPT